MNNNAATLFGNYEITYAPHYKKDRQQPEFYRNHSGADVVATVTINNKTKDERQFDIVAVGEMRYVFPFTDETIYTTDDLEIMGVRNDEDLNTIIRACEIVNHDYAIHNPWFELWEMTEEGYEYSSFVGFSVDEGIEEALNQLLADPNPTKVPLPDNVIPLW